MANHRLCDSPQVIADYACLVGENPLWHPEDRCLLWTDIPRGRLFRFEPEINCHGPFYEGRSVGGFTIQQDGSLLLFKDRGTITCWSESGEVTLVPEIAEERELRFNDVIADPVGRVFCGTFTSGRKGRLYRLNTDGSLSKLLDGIGCSNGMAFTLDRTGFFYTDSFAHTIYRFDYEEAEGTIWNQRVFYSVPQQAGFPDGCTVDSDGFLWFALWGGESIVRLDPKGRVDTSIHIPAKNPTSLTFAGGDLKDVYVTSEAGGGRSATDPLAGALFRLRSRIAGRAEYFSRIILPNEAR